MESFRAQGSMFEGLYVRNLKPQGEFKAQLKAAGFDLDAPEPSYPMDVWVKCLDVTWKNLYPELSRELAWQRIGGRFIEGYLDTLVGKVIAAMFPFLTPRMFVTRVPRMMKSGIEEVRVDVQWEDEKTAVILLHGPHEGSAHVLAGVLGECMRRLKAEARLMPESLPGIDSRLRVVLS